MPCNTAGTAQQSPEERDKCLDLNSKFPRSKFGLVANPSGPGVWLSWLWLILVDVQTFLVPRG